ncbi:MAG: STAS domain-containing protein [Limnobacter sp.]|nr:STAS domain-containing protein [Limnobacter sp.]
MQEASFSQQATAPSEKTTWSLASLTICECSALYERLKNALGQGQSITLDLAHCEEVDTAGIQLLAAIQNDPQASLKINWTKPHEALLHKAAQLGMSSWIEAGSV